MKASTEQKARKKQKKNIPVGIAHVSSSFNNTIITITDLQGNTVAWASAGGQGFKGAKKSTPYAAQITAEAVGKKAMEFGMKTISVAVKGPGGGRESAVRSLMGAGFIITSIKDVTPVAHNGTRPPKRRRV
jgi:small subunit ribosomal protein S11